MNFVEFLILYLSCGAPFGVYHYFQQKELSLLHRQNFKILLVSLLTILFWFPLSFKYFHKFVTKKLKNTKFSPPAENEQSTFKQIDIFADFLLKCSHPTKLNFSIFEFRETFQRFTGLNLYLLKSQDFGLTAPNQIFELAAHDNPILAQVCLQRRNRSQIVRHLQIARRDFLQILQELFINCHDQEELLLRVDRFADFIKDKELTRSFQEVIPDFKSNSSESQSTYKINSKNPEKAIKVLPVDNGLTFPVASTNQFISSRD